MLSLLRLQIFPHQHENVKQTLVFIVAEKFRGHNNSRPSSRLRLSERWPPGVTVQR